MDNDSNLAATRNPGSKSGAGNPMKSGEHSLATSHETTTTTNEQRSEAQTPAIHKNQIMEDTSPSITTGRSHKRSLDDNVQDIASTKVRKDENSPYRPTDRVVPVPFAVGVPDRSSSSEIATFPRSTRDDLYGEGNYQEDNGDDEEEEGSDQKEDGDDETLNPISELPEGMVLEWNNDKMGATFTVHEQIHDTCTATRELRVCLVGRARVQVIVGAMEVLGRVLTSNDEDHSSTVIRSPFWSSWMALEALVVPCVVKLQCIGEFPYSFRLVAPTRPIVVPPAWKKAADDILRDFGDVSNTVPALARTSLDVDQDDDEGSPRQESPFQRPPVQPLYDHPPQIAMITGAKGVGKSTFLRYMTNRLLSRDVSATKVAILDADVGQPELAPPGLLRLAIVEKPLLHPPYWNLVGDIDYDDDDESGGDEDCSGSNYRHSAMKVVSSIFFGSVTSKADPTRYVDAIQILMEHYRQRVASSSPLPVPLLINMDGWVKGVGYQILSSLVGSLRPNHLVQIVGETRGQTFDLSTSIHVTMQETTHMYQLPSCTSVSEASVCHIPSLTMRNFRWATYFLPQKEMISTFHAWDFVFAKNLQTGWIAVADKNFRNANAMDETNGDHDDLLKDECRLARALAKERPFCVPMETVDCFVIGSDFEDHLRYRKACIDDNSRKRERIFQAMNGSIVSLCTDTTTMESLGFGLIRSIDWNQRLLYVIVPPTIDADSLPQVKALVGGRGTLPLAMVFRGVYSESFPYLTTLDKRLPSPSSAILGSEPMKSRNNIARRNTVNVSTSAASSRRGSKA